jgi:hypothetical protein
VRRHLVAAVLTAGLAVTLAGCSKSSPGTGIAPTTPATTAPANPVDLMAHSTDAIQTTSYHESITQTTPAGDLTILGDVDPNAKELIAKYSGTVSIEIRTKGTDVWVNAPALGAAKPWIHLDATKLPDTSAIKSGLDFKATFGILTGVSQATESSPGNYTGTLDLAKAKAAQTTKAGQDGIQALIDAAGTGAGAVPFQATLDGQHRLLSLSFDVTSAKSGQLGTKIVVSDYGKPVAFTQPAAADVTEATAQMYSQF